MSSLLNRITSNPRQCGGRPCIRGMRIRVSDVLDLLASGIGENEVLEGLPVRRALLRRYGYWIIYDDPW